MRTPFVVSAAILAVNLAPLPGPAHLQADEGQVQISTEGTNTWIQIYGDADDDWRLQESTDLITWITKTNFGTLLSGRTNAPMRSAGSHTNPDGFYRALKTDGLYDTTVLRTFSLTFTQPNFSNLLALARTYNTNVYFSPLTLDNGATNTGLGARFRGNTSFTGMGGPGGGGVPIKKSVAIEVNFTDTNADLMHYDNLNLNNAYLDETLMRETLFFNVMRQYTVCPRCCLAKLYINGANWGVYSCAQQQDGSLINEYFPSNDGDRWRAPNMGGGGPGGGSSALNYLGTTNVASYRNYYELKATKSTNAWQRLVNAINVLNNTPAAQLRDKAEDVLAVDRWLWFLAIENIFTDEDSYYFKGADYMFYYEPESGRIHPIEHDGNESSITTDYTLTPVEGATSTARPVLRQFLSNAELRQRYLAHMRTVLKEAFNPAILTSVIQQQHALSIAAILADPKKGFTMTAYTNDLVGLKTFVTNRYKFLTNHAELKPLAPVIASVHPPMTVPTALDIPYVTAEVAAQGANGISSVWLYHRAKSYGRFASTQMFDDGLHGDGMAGDGLFGAATTNYPSGTKVRFYVEARSANTAKAAVFAPPRAEQETYFYRVALTTASNSPVVINEFMADNETCLADPQGEYDDWIELHNLTSQEVDLTGRYLSDEPNNPRKWQFSAGTKIPADGYLLVWADEDGSATPGLHASFKLSAGGEQLMLVDTDANLNVVLDYIDFGPQGTDQSYGRLPDHPDLFGVLSPTPGSENK